MKQQQRRWTVITTRRMRSGPRAIGAAVILLLLVALSACGNAEGSGDPATSGTAAESAEQGGPVGGESAPRPAAHYPLETDLASSVADTPALEPIGDVELVDDDDPSGSTAAEFGVDDGFALDVANLVASDTYTLAFRFYLDSDDRGWLKLVDLDDRTADRGFYAYKGGLQFYRHTLVDGEAPLGGPPYATVVLRRDADERLSWFVDGEQVADIDDRERYQGALRSDTLHFFVDDTTPNDSGSEQSSGRVAWLSVYDEALSDQVIAELSP